MACHRLPAKQLRAALFAKEQGYQILIDSDREWTYVNMAEYILPNTLECAPRPEWRTRERTPVGEQGWEDKDHIRTSRNDGMWHLEAHVRYFLLPFVESLAPLVVLTSASFLYCVVLRCVKSTSDLRLTA